MWLLNTVGAHLFSSRDQHEADARTIRHAIQSKDSNPIVGVASDTDIYAIDRLSLNNILHRV